MPKRAAPASPSCPKRTPTPRALIKAVRLFKDIEDAEEKAERAAQRKRTRRLRHFLGLRRKST